MGASEVDLGCADINADPDGWARERLAGGPVQRRERDRAWLLLTYKAATEGFLDPRLSADRTPAFGRALARRGAAFEELAADGDRPTWHGNPLGRSIRDMPVVL